MSTLIDRLGRVRTSLAWKAPCRVATTENIVLTGFQTINGVTLASTDENLRVLVKDQDDPTENGIWDAQARAWTRAKDFNGDDDVAKGTSFLVTDGTTGSGWYKLTSDEPIEIGDTELTFSVFNDSTLQDAQTALTAQAAAVTAALALKAPLTDVMSKRFATTGLFQAATIGTDVKYVTVDRIEATGPLAPLTYKRGTATPSGVYGEVLVSGVYWAPLYDVAPYNAGQFGVVGDGVTNDTSAAQAALTAGAGRAVRFPPGSYAITAALSVSAGTTVFCAPGEATITQGTNNTNGLTIAGDNVTIDGLTVVGPNTGTGSAIYASSRNNPIIRNCRVQTWIFGVTLQGCKNWTVIGNRFWGGTYDGSSSSDIFIYGSSGAPSSRGLITNNFCLSNNDCGISVDTNSGDKDTVIANNIVWPLQSDGVTSLADANNRRRYGIIVGYNGTSASRAVVSANLIRDVPHSGIYAITSTRPNGDLAITGNMVSRCGFGTLYPADASLRAGIWCNGGADTITGNTIVDCETAGIKIAPDFAYSSTTQPRAVVSSNIIARTNGFGIHLTNKPHGYLVANNRVINSTEYNIYYETTASDGGNCHFVGNHVDSNGTDTGGVVVANGSGGYSCSVSGNRLSGSDNTTNDQFNSGVWFQGAVHVTGNHISKFHRGVNCADSLGRTLDLKCSGNAIDNCVYGISGSGAGPWLVSDNTFDTVTNDLNGSAWQGILLRGPNGYAIYVADTAAPTGGTWAVGDHCAKTNVSAGNPKGWFCTAAGTPGTWTSEGNL